VSPHASKPIAHNSVDPATYVTMHKTSTIAQYSSAPRGGGGNHFLSFRRLRIFPQKPNFCPCCAVYRPLGYKCSPYVNRKDNIRPTSLPNLDRAHLPSSSSRYQYAPPSDPGIVIHKPPELLSRPESTRDHISSASILPSPILYL